MSEERREGMAALTARVNAIDEKLVSLEQYQIAAVAERSEFKEQLSANTEMTAKIEKNTAGVVEAWKAIEGGLKVLGFLALLAKWCAYIAGAVTAVAAALHIGNGIRPK